MVLWIVVDYQITIKLKINYFWSREIARKIYCDQKSNPSDGNKIWFKRSWLLFDRYLNQLPLIEFIYCKYLYLEMLISSFSYWNWVMRLAAKPWPSNNFWTWQIAFLLTQFRKSLSSPKSKISRLQDTFTKFSSIIWFQFYFFHNWGLEAIQQWFSMC